RSKQLGEAALVRAVEDINTELNGEMFPRWLGGGIWADGAIFSTYARTLAASTNLLDGYVTNYIPRSLWRGAQQASQKARWLAFEYRDGNTNRLVGRYSYVLLDSSGLIDVNFD